MGGAHGKRKLSKDDLEFLKENTNFDEATIREWHKGFYQDCPNGKLSPQKFMEIYRVFFPSGSAESFCDHVFRTFDADNNGYIDFKEFLLAVNVTSAGTPEAKLKWAFKMYDIDGNGTIDQKEMVKIIQAIYDMLGSEVKKAKMEPPQERAKRIFAKMDVNGDGILTQEEFIQGCLEDDELRQILAANTMKQ